MVLAQSVSCKRTGAILSEGSYAIFEEIVCGYCRQRAEPEVALRKWTRNNCLKE